jgi:hypothetical protein
MALTLGRSILHRLAQADWLPSFLISALSSRRTSFSSKMTPRRPNSATEGVPVDFIEDRYDFFDIAVTPAPLPA